MAFWLIFNKKLIYTYGYLKTVKFLFIIIPLFKFLSKLVTFIIFNISYFLFNE